MSFWKRSKQSSAGDHILLYQQRERFWTNMVWVVVVGLLVNIVAGLLVSRTAFRFSKPAVEEELPPGDPRA
jgi:hypothetical protein